MVTMINHVFYNGDTPSGETSETHDIARPGTFSVDFDGGAGEKSPAVTLMYKQPSSGRLVEVVRFNGPGTVALDQAPRTIAVQVGANPDNVPVHAEWQGE
jgi:hypothetical protein